jgi:hypothetical protein
LCWKGKPGPSAAIANIFNQRTWQGQRREVLQAFPFGLLLSVLSDLPC